MRRASSAASSHPREMPFRSLPTTTATAPLSSASQYGVGAPGDATTIRTPARRSHGSVSAVVAAATWTWKSAPTAP
jgi:hypothetical protein